MTDADIALLAQVSWPTIASLATAAGELVREALGEGRFSWSLAGPRRLKGISEPVRMYRVHHKTAVG